MKKSVLSVSVISALMFTGSSVASSDAVSMAALHMPTKSVSASGVQNRIFDDRIAIEFSQPVFSLSGGVVGRLVDNLSKTTGLDLSVSKMMMNRFVIVDVKNVRGDGDIVSALSRLGSVPGVVNVSPNYRLTKSSVDSFPNPGWRSTQYPRYSAVGNPTVSSYYYNPRFLELTDFFESVSFGDSRLAIVDGDFVPTPNLPHSVFEQTQTIVNGKFSNSLPGASNDLPHGTYIAAYIGGRVNPDYGTVGMARNLPLTAIDVYGASNSGTAFDLIDGILYSANLHDGAVQNPNSAPAKVINISSNQPNGTPCENIFQSAINRVTNAGSLVVFSSGNDGVGSISAPANCKNVISVGAVEFDGLKATYSNYSGDLTVSAVSSNRNTFVYTTTSQDRGGPDGVGVMSGTSFSAPYVSMMLAYAKSVKPSMNYQDAVALIKRSSIPFNQDDPFCGGLVCGGLLDPVKFVQEVSGENLLEFTRYTGQSAVPEQPPVEEPPVQPPVEEPSAPQDVRVSLAGTATNPRDIAIFEAGNPVSVASVQSTEDSITVNFGREGVFVVRFTGTPVTNTSSVSGDSALYEFTVDARTSPANVGGVTRLSDPINPTAPTEQPPVAIPAPTSSGGGGGGASTLPGLLGLGGLLLMFRRKNGVVRKA